MTVLLAQDQLSTRLTLLALEAVGDPSASTRVLNLLEDLSALVEICEEQVGLVVPLGPQRLEAQPLRLNLISFFLTNKYALVSNSNLIPGRRLSSKEQWQGDGRYCREITLPPIRLYSTTLQSVLLAAQKIYP